ncbi:MAG: DNA gyrase/topoisomerase IV subunit A [Bacteroidota bacterium]
MQNEHPDNGTEQTPGNESGNNNGNQDNRLTGVLPVSGLYESWFLDYASYTILERAVPSLEDGLKPVQRRIMHAMKEMDDGRYNKVANIIGQTMQYHPHGDASIADAIVNLGQKDLLIDCQGNWGDHRTGDRAAAPRYIEARPSKFALDILYNPQTTVWQSSYDGRKKEPLTLPVKFPLLLAQGVDGIAVGLATKVMPHNFIELIEASIDHLYGRPVNLVPDFPTGGYVDAGNYREGMRGGKVRIRAKIEEIDKKTLVIREIPYSTTTTSLMESIVKAGETGKIKIKKVTDNTAKDVEIQIQLAPGVSPDITIDALYAFTECEVSLSPNACIIFADKPRFVSINEILRLCTDQTKELLRQELEIKKAELLEKILFSSLEKIFIENRIYRDIEECETWEAVITTIDKGLEPFKPQFYRVITTEDITKLTEIRIKRISKFDAFRADEHIRSLNDELTETLHHLEHLRDWTIKFFRDLLKKYGKGRERKTEIRAFDKIATAVVAADNQKLYVNYADGFIGFGIKKDEYICDCNDLDDVIIFRRDGNFKVVKIGEKVFVGKDLIHVGVFRKTDERQVYNMTYLDGETGFTYVKRFQVLGVTRDKDYDLTKGAKGSKVTYFSANPNGEAEVINIQLSQGATAKIKNFDYNFAGIDIKGRASQGNILTRYVVKKIIFKSAGVSTLGGLSIWFDETIGRLNTDARGTLLGNFEGSDNIIVIRKDGTYELTSFEVTNRYEQDQLLYISRFDREAVYTAVYMEGESKMHYVKRFKIDTLTANKRFPLIPDTKGSQLLLASGDPDPVFELKLRRDKKAPEETLKVHANEQTEVKGRTALGSKILAGILTSIKWLSPLKPQKPASIPVIPQSAAESKSENAEVRPEAKPAKPAESDFGSLFS